MDRETRARLRWVELFQETGNAGLVCVRCGISRPTLRKWIRRFEKDGADGLRSRSRRPLHSPARKVTSREEQLILKLRKRNIGARRIQAELRRLHDIRLSTATIHKVLKRLQVKGLKRFQRKKRYRRYERPVPGDRVQMDVFKVRPGLYQYTSVDDCTRYRVLGLYPRRAGENTLQFLDKVLEETPFPIQRIQTDRGREFFAIKVQQRLMDWGIKFRPIRPAAPHLNGKVERSQRTDLEEFYATADLDAETLVDRLQEWQHYYNWDRPHGALGGRSPMDRFFQLIHKVPLSEEVDRLYVPAKERLQEPQYAVEMQLRKLKPPL